MLCILKIILLFIHLFTKMCQKFELINFFTLKCFKSPQNLDIFLRWETLIYMLRIINKSFAGMHKKILLYYYHFFFLCKMFRNFSKFYYLSKGQKVTFYIKYNHCIIHIQTFCRAITKIWMHCDLFFPENVSNLKKVWMLFFKLEKYF